MLRQWSVARLQADLGALEASAERARAALDCIYSSSNEFEAAAMQMRDRFGERQHQERQRAINTAIYEDLGLVN